MLLSPCLPLLSIFLNVCLSYNVGPIGGFEQEELADPQAPSFNETNPVV
jgi:hypothetical protein